MISVSNKQSGQIFPFTKVESMKGWDVSNHDSIPLPLSVSSVNAAEDVAS